MGHGHSVELIDNNNNICGVVTHTQCDYSRVHVASFIVSHRNGLLKDDLFECVAVSLALRYLWNDQQFFHREKIIDFYLTQIQKTINSADMSICGRLLKGACLHTGNTLTFI